MASVAVVPGRDGKRVQGSCLVQEEDTVGWKKKREGGFRGGGG